MTRKSAAAPGAEAGPPAPRPPAVPRISTQLATDAVHLGDDALILDHALEPNWADQTVEFVEVGQCRFTGGTIADGRWTKSRWTDIASTDTDLANLEFDGWWTRVQLHGVRGTGLLSTNSTWQHVSLTDTQTDFLTLRFSTAQTVAFHNCSLRRADFTGSRLTDVLFDGSDLTGARFDQVRAERLWFVNCELAELSGVGDLRGAVMQPKDLASFAHQLAAVVGITLR